MIDDEMVDRYRRRLLVAQMTQLNEREAIIDAKVMVFFKDRPAPEPEKKNEVVEEILSQLCADDSGLEDEAND